MRYESQISLSRPTPKDRGLSRFESAQDWLTGADSPGRGRAKPVRRILSLTIFVLGLGAAALAGKQILNQSDQDALLACAEPITYVTGPNGANERRIPSTILNAPLITRAPGEEFPGVPSSVSGWTIDCSNLYLISDQVVSPVTQ